MENNKTINQTQHKKDVAVIWARVSHESQASGLESQVEACNNFASKHDIEITQTFKVTNDGICDHLHRAMLTYVAQHPEVKTILVSSFDRLSRRDAEAIVTKAFLKIKGITVFGIKQPQEHDSLVGDLLENAFFLYQQFENNFCRARRHRHSQKRI